MTAQPPASSSHVRDYQGNGFVIFRNVLDQDLIQQLRRRTDIPNVLSSEMDARFVDETKAVDVILKAGDVSIHHPNIIHGSNANTSPRRRCGLTIRYIPTSTRILSDDFWPSAFLLRGEAVPGVNRYNPKPRYVEGEHMPFRGCDAWR